MYYSFITGWQNIYLEKKAHRGKVCGKAFTQRSQIGEHTGATPPKCSKCGKTFTLSSGIRT